MFVEKLKVGAEMTAFAITPLSHQSNQKIV